MTRTESFKRQHKELLELASEITPLLKAEELSKDAKGVRNLLATLAGKLKVHLTMEDSSLYPSLLNSTDDKVRQVTQKYIDEMGGIKQVFSDYTTKWPSPTAIQNNPVQFIKETLAIFDALGKRIQKEDEGLYPLVDSL